MTTPVSTIPCVRATVRVGAVVPLPLRTDLERKIIRVVVDTHLHLPGMFEITFLDDDGTVAGDRSLNVGAAVEILGGAPSSRTAQPLINGEITSVEAVCEAMSIHTVIRGYEKAHRLQRTRRTRTFVNMKDSDIARRIALDARLPLGDIDETRTTHAHLPQVAQSDWDFLTQRARECGFETGVSEGKFYFRRASGSSSLPVRLPGTRPALAFKDNLLTFRPRLSSAALAPRIEVRSWNPDATTVAVGRAAADSTTADLTGGIDADELTDPFFSPGLGAALARMPAAGSGSKPDPDAHVVVNRPLAQGPSAAAAADEAARAAAEHIASTFAEAEGLAIGDPHIQAGHQVDIRQVPAPFAGAWTVTNARHVFCEEDGGYLTRFYVSGRQDRSLLGLASLGATQHTPQPVQGLVCGIVTNINDPASKGRVKVSLPWLSPDYESDWARVAQVGAGKRSGALFIPEVGDEVLVGFELADLRRPFVLAGLINGQSGYNLGGDAVVTSGHSTAAVQRRGIATPSGNRLVFTDDVPTPHGRAKASSITLGTARGNLSLAIDQKAGTVTLRCDPATPDSDRKNGTITISCGTKGTVNVLGGQGGTVNVDAGGTLNLKAAQNIRMESQGRIHIKGRTVQINGTPIKLN
ncbi:type IV secretion protein Rhs [Streptomyces spinoverrucosus]|uniref:Type IV secretion protein Rhs n=1 Tax=Streptomyces spinoverrucosus TaxID=284043 RepID=A0A4Y3VV81_9ACTN|nr:phage baseplate assembly protein V [Streptomyces spinoverrucosus]GEC09579.1 type IV secretion protein Rhs [Streptomyces spinoverrucosus]GHB96073.1 type IV secretion protein Rhs [Streptomyces spinoverrucosus]